MKLSIITINRNNAAGLEATLSSIVSQTFKDFEYIIVDGASKDGSVEVIKKFEPMFKHLKWVSEPDAGIYNAMNKGIRMATGEYVEFLNSGDFLAGPDIVQQMLEELEIKDNPSILYGNMLKDMPNGGILIDKCFAGHDITLLGLYSGTLNHSPAFIRKDLFQRYGLYDESLKIVSDWKWYLQVIVFGKEKPIYTDLDVTIFDMNGISETNKTLEKAERQRVLTQLIPPTILADYEKWAFHIVQMKRLQRHPWAYKLVWFVERCLFRMEKRQRKRSGVSGYQ